MEPLQKEFQVRSGGFFCLIMKKMSESLFPTDLLAEFRNRAANGQLSRPEVSEVVDFISYQDGDQDAGAINPKNVSFCYFEMEYSTTTITPHGSLGDALVDSSPQI